MTEPRTRRRPTKLSAETKWEIFLPWHSMTVYFHPSGDDG
jgi:hypothetical protein